MRRGFLPFNFVSILFLLPTFLSSYLQFLFFLCFLTCDLIIALPLSLLLSFPHDLNIISFLVSSNVTTRLFILFFWYFTFFFFFVMILFVFFIIFLSFSGNLRPPNYILGCVLITVIIIFIFFFIFIFAFI